jgi:tetratricopeptide (TPR) repeat protein
LNKGLDEIMAERDVFDVFVSYRRSDGEIVRLLVSGLLRRGMKVWFDELSMQDFGGMSDSVRQGLASSKALLAYYSANYPLSAPCQWELTSGYLASEHLGDPRERVLVVNPEPGPGHIEPVQLRDALYQSVSGADQVRIDEIADAIARHVAGLEGQLGAGTVEPAVWLPTQPSGATRFVGRQREMWKIHSALHAHEATMIQVAPGPGLVQLRGLGGIGKSLLAREYALRFSGSYPGGVFWLYAQGDLAKESTETEREALRLGQFRGFAVSVLGPDRAAGIDSLAPADTETVLRDALNRTEPCLWVVDDMPVGLSAEEVQRWLGPTSASTLVTTRSAEYGAFMTEIALGVLQPHEALEVLRARRVPSDEKELAAAHAIVRELGGHALAIDVAGATLRFQPYSALLDHLLDPTEDELELAAALREELPTGSQRSISATLSRSLNRLGPEGQDLLRLASMVARDPIQRWLLSDVFALVDSVTGSAARARTMRALDHAVSLSLIEPVENDSWQVHPLLARTVALKDTDKGRSAALRQSAVRVLKDKLSDITEPETRAEVRGLVSHARRLSQEITTLEEAKLRGSVARYDFEVGDYRTAKLGHEQEISALTELLGVRHPFTLSAMGRLAATLRCLGDLHEARALSEDVFSSTSKVLGPRHLNTLIAMEELAFILFRLGELQEARSLNEAVLAGRREVLGQNHSETLHAMVDLACTLSVIGDLQGSRELGEEALLALQASVGSRHPETLRTMGNLALTLNRSGVPQAARDLEEQVLVAFRETLGPRHPNTLLAMNNLAFTLREVGELAAARELAQESLRVEREVLGPRHVATLSTIDTLACILFELGALRPARELGEEALDAYREVLGKHHFDTIGAMYHLADTLRSSGDLTAARILGAEALTASRESVGPRHAQTLAAMRSFTAILMELGELEEARDLREETVVAAQEVLGDHHPDTIASLEEFTATLHALGDAATAAEVEKKISDKRDGHGS